MGDKKLEVERKLRILAEKCLKILLTPAPEFEKKTLIEVNEMQEDLKDLERYLVLELSCLEGIREQIELQN